MAVFEIPLSPQSQKFSITLSGVNYNLRVWFNADTQGGWYLDIFDDNDVLILTGIPLVTGDDLLGQYEYLGINGSLQVETDTDLAAPPTFENLGITSHLYFITSDAAA